jgi:transposase
VVTDSRRMCQVLIGLGDVNVLDVTETVHRLEITIETRVERPSCAGCGGGVRVKDRAVVRLVDLPCFGRSTVLRWRKRRWLCPTPGCDLGSFTEDVPTIGAARLALTDRAGRWVTAQVGGHGRSVQEVAIDLGCSWHTVMDAVIAYGRELIDDPGRFADVEALGLDETLMFRQGPWKRQQWSTQIVDVGRGQLLDVVRDRNAIAPTAWLAQQSQAWRDGISWATLDLSASYRKVFDTMLPDAIQVADPFHVHKVRHEALCVRRRVRGPPC